MIFPKKNMTSHTSSNILNVRADYLIYALAALIVTLAVIAPPKSFHQNEPVLQPSERELVIPDYVPVEKSAIDHRRETDALRQIIDAVYVN